MELTHDFPNEYIIYYLDRYAEDGWVQAAKVTSHRDSPGGKVYKAITLKGDHIIEVLDQDAFPSYDAAMASLTSTVSRE